MKPNRTILDAVAAPEVFGAAFRPAATWKAWRAFLGALFGLELGPQASELCRRHTGRADLPASPFREAWVIAGRRGGKSRVAALVATFVAAFRDHSRYLAPGEVATVMVLAANRRQAKVVLKYVQGLIEVCPMLEAMVVGATKESFEFSNRAVIEIHTSSFRSVRGYTIPAAILDEISFWPSDEASANPDVEVVNALRPAMATVPDALLLGISSPYARRGVLWDAYRRHHAKEGAPVLVWRGETRAMNPAVPETLVADELARDEASARAEYLAEFRTDIESFVPREAVEEAVVPGRRELPPLSPEVGKHVAFVDPSGGSADSFTLAIAHVEKRGSGPTVAVLDAIRERQPKPGHPFSPESAIEEFATLLRTYRVSRVIGDRYAGEFAREPFRRRGIEYVLADQPKSDLYRDFLPLLNSGRVELLDHAKLVTQLCSLERRTARGGRDSIDHSPGAHDDVANAVAGVLVAMVSRPSASRGRAGSLLIADRYAGGLHG